MKVSDLMIDGKGLFHYMNEISELPFENLTGIESLDLGYIMNHGSRNLISMVNKLENGEVTETLLKTISRVIINTYYRKWSDLFTLYELEVDQYQYEHIINETITDKGSSTDSRTSVQNDLGVDRVTGYNSDEFVDHEQEDNTREQTEQSTGVNDNTRNLERTSKGRNISNVWGKYQGINNLKNIFIYDIIYSDINNLITLKIYD